MSGVKSVLTLSLVSVIGITLLVLSCALPSFQTWWPMFVVVFYILAPMPLSIAKHMRYDSAGTSPGVEFAVFATTGIVISAFALPLVLAHAHVITFSAYCILFIANVVIFADIYGIYMYFHSDVDSFSFLW